jgi:hypothetical protein
MAVAAAAWQWWEAQGKLGSSDGGRADATAAVLPLRAIVVATKTPAVTVVQITIYKQQKRRRQWRGKQQRQQ